jgi:cyclophilin family peptidyl-prolyl cis-trans isomerase
VKKLLFVLLLAFVTGGISARAQEVIDPNHSVVRFEIFSAGTNFGSIDIELFDQEKPVTVRNFLRYVYNGVYSDLVLHRLVPGFVVQGGHVRLPNPDLTTPFTTYTRGANFGQITNEYSVGPELGNDYGTIAMAREPGNTNSASADWFFNLTNNVFLNNVDGGFTVFGRVVNTSGPRTGTNLLNYFKGFSESNDIGSAIIFDYFEVLNELPISTNRPSGVLISDLFTVQASIIQGPYRVDPNHSVVRFDIVTDGVYFGNIDIELFDQEKPETVRNFLLYVYSGVYSNLVLHQLRPNVALQGGHVRLETNLYSSSDFTTYTPGVNWGRITNEYSVGPELSNDLGTIAMARVAGETNSASADFFFNLGNNTNLNTVDGGFTVFGRIVGTFSDGTGTNILNKFNTLSASNGIKSVFITDFFEFLAELPVSALHYTLSTNVTVTDGMTNFTIITNNAPVQYRDLFTVQASVLQGNSHRDTNAPMVFVDNSGGVIRTTNASVNLSGTASDNMEVARVLFDTPLGRFLANGKDVWNGDVPLTPGTNIIVVHSLDYFGNLSPGTTNVVFYSLPRPVTLQTIGKGKVTGLADGQLLEVGVNYALTAQPARGYRFNGWRGGVVSGDRNVIFTMFEGASVTARFTKSFLGMDIGEYQGVFAPSTNGPPQYSGFISIKLANNGIYSGRLNPIGASFGIRGQFGTNGSSTISGPLGTNVIVLTLQWLGEGSEGFIGAYYDNHGHFLSQANLWRVQSFSATNPAPAGLYTFNLSPPLAANNELTDGSGFGTMTVDDRGRINITGLLADNKPIKQKAVLLKGNRFPFLYSVKKGDSVVGLVNFATNDTFSSNVKWFSPDFPGNTNQNVTLNGSRYTPPTQARLFDWTNGVITLSGDGLAVPISSDVILADDGSFSIPSNPHNIQINVTNANGWIGGTFTHPVSQVPTVLKGAVLQSSNSAAGFFPGATNGGFTIRSAP